MNESNKRLILAVAVNDENSTYSVDIPAGSNAAETAFAISVIIRCFIKDGIIESSDTMLDMITKYSKDSQYEEV